jgi:hypothetical protein
MLEMRNLETDNVHVDIFFLFFFFTFIFCPSRTSAIDNGTWQDQCRKKMPTTSWQAQ